MNLPGVNRRSIVTPEDLLTALVTMETPTHPPQESISFVMAALCAFMPFGTVLGVFTIIVLSKESVQRLYESAAGQTPERHF